MESPTPANRQSSRLTPSTSSRASRPARRLNSTTPMTPPTIRKTYRPRISWTNDIEVAILEALISAIRKGYYIDSSYKAKGWNIALTRV